MVERLDKRAVSEEIQSCGVPLEPEVADARASHLKRGWCRGMQAFGEAMRKLGQKLMKKARPVSRAYQKSAPGREHEERQALEWLAKGLKAGGLKPGDLGKVEGIGPPEGAAGGPAMAADGGVAKMAI